jgi:transketolase
MTRSASVRTARPISRSSSSRRCGPSRVYRPGDPVETAECWESILDTPRQTALLALSRQPMPLLRRDPGNEIRSAKGGYILLEAEGGERKLTILSTGSELHLAVEARDILQKEGIPTAVISMSCRLLFEAQDAAYKKAVLGTAILLNMLSGIPGLRPESTASPILCAVPFTASATSLITDFSSRAGSSPS